LRNYIRISRAGPSAGGPLTLRSLIAQNIDIPEFSKKFLDSVEWKDYGPYVYSYCNDVLSFLLKDESINNRTKDLINLEKQVVSLMLNYKEVSVTKGIYKTKKVTYYKSSFNLSYWLKNKTEIGTSSLKEVSENYLIYLPDLESSHKFVIIPQRATDIYNQIKEKASSREELSNRLIKNKQKELSKDDDKYLKILTSYNAIGI
jgi:hypothetical protein